MTAVAVSLGAFCFNPFAGLLLGPALMGSLVGGWRSRTMGGAFTGLLSAYYWSFLVTALLGPVVLGFLLSDVQSLDFKTPATVVIFFLIATASIGGGYVGGVVEVSSTHVHLGREARENTVPLQHTET